MVDGDPTTDNRPTAAEWIMNIVEVAKRLEAGALTTEEAYEQATVVRRAAAGLGNLFADADDAMRSAAQVTATLSTRLDEGSQERRCAEEIAGGLASSVEPPLELDFDALVEADLLSDEADEELEDPDDEDDEDDGDDEDDDEEIEDPGEELHISGREWFEISHMNGSRTFALEVRSAPDSAGTTIRGTLVRTVTWGADDCEFAACQSWLRGVSVADLRTPLWDARIKRETKAKDAKGAR